MIKMKNYSFAIVISSIAFLIFSSTTIAQNDTLAIHKVLNNLFDGMREGNGQKVQSVFTEDAKLNSVYTTKQGEFVVRSEKPSAFVEAVDTPHEEVWNEKLLSVEIRIDGNLAQVWTPYEFYLNDDFQHCGVNAFHLVRTQAGWKILQLTDTRRRSTCDKLKE